MMHWSFCIMQSYTRVLSVLSEIHIKITGGLKWIKMVALPIVLTGDTVLIQISMNSADNLNLHKINKITITQVNYQSPPKKNFFFHFIFIALICNEILIHNYAMVILSTRITFCEYFCNKIHCQSSAGDTILLVVASWFLHKLQYQHYILAQY